MYLAATRLSYNYSGVDKTQPMLINRIPVECWGKLVIVDMWTHIVENKTTLAIIEQYKVVLVFNYWLILLHCCCQIGAIIMALASHIF